MVIRAMKLNFSWEKSAAKYVEVFKAAKVCFLCVCLCVCVRVRVLMCVSIGFEFARVSERE
jgi:hypothetical protein